MSRIKGTKSSAALLVAVVALFAALGGGAVAGVALNGAERAEVREIAKRQADKRIDERQSSLSPVSAGAERSISRATRRAVKRLARKVAKKKAKRVIESLPDPRLEGATIEHTGDAVKLGNLRPGRVYVTRTYDGVTPSCLINGRDRGYTPVARLLSTVGTTETAVPGSRTILEPGVRQSVTLSGIYNTVSRKVQVSTIWRCVPGIGTDQSGPERSITSVLRDQDPQQGYAGIRTHWIRLGD